MFLSQPKMESDGRIIRQTREPMRMHAKPTPSRIIRSAGKSDMMESEGCLKLDTHRLCLLP